MRMQTILARARSCRFWGKAAAWWDGLLALQERRLPGPAWLAHVPGGGVLLRALRRRRLSAAPRRPRVYPAGTALENRLLPTSVGFLHGWTTAEGTGAGTTNLYFEVIL